MLRKIYFLVVLLITTSVTTKLLAQTTGPDGVIFQAVATDPQGNPAANRTIYIKDAILQTTATGTVVYSETFQVTASSTGVFTIVIGKGQRLSGPTSIASLDWSAGPYFLNLKAAVAPSLPLANWNVDQQYVDMGTSQFWTVPFALFASKVAGFDLKLNIADTANMLKPYMKRSDTASLSARIDATKLAVTQETTRALAAEALKANTTDVTASLALKANINNPTFTGIVGGIDKTMVGLNNVDNTSDINKPVSTATQTALNLKANTSDVTTSLALKANINNPTFTGTVGGITKTMVGLGNVDNTSDINKPVSTATQTILNNKANSSDVTTGLALKANINNPTFTGTVGGIDKTMVGLANADNTSDANKPISTATQTALNLKANINNPTFTGTVGGITKTMVGLANADNTSDVNKPISTATQTALDLKANTTDVTASLALKANSNSPTFTGTVAGIDKTMVGLGNADNTSDVNKPISTATQTALNLKENAANKSTATTLGTSDVLFPTQNAVKTYVDVTVSDATPDADATTKGKIQLAGDLGGTAASPTVPGLASKANTSDVTTSLALKANINNPTFTGTVSGITKSMVGLSNADNTSDANKPVSTAAQTALDLKANLASPTFTGTVSGITKSMVGLSNADNTSDANKPVSTAAQTALNLKEDLTNKSTTTTLGTSDVFYPTQKAVKTYVDAQIASAAISIGTIGSSNANAASLTSGVLRLSPADGTNGGIVTTSAQTIAGAKTFTTAPVLSSATASQALFTDLNKNIVSNSITGTGNVVMSTSPTLVTPNIGAATGTSLSVTGQLTSTVATGTAPLVVSSTTPVANLNIGGNAATVTTNANLTGVVTSVGNATSIANGAITNAMLANSAVANLSGTNTGDNAVNSLYSGLISNATHTGDVTGATVLTIANNAVTTSKVLDANITTSKIADGNITTSKIADGNVTDAKIATVSATKITGILPVANGGTGATTLTGYVKGSGTTALTASASIPVADVTGAAPLSSPTFTGTPAAPTAIAGTSTTQLATTAFVTAATQNFVDLTTAQTIAGAKIFSTDLTVNGLTIGRGQGNTIYGDNTALGNSALYTNTTGRYNTATGWGALKSNTTGEQNTANGFNALSSNTLAYYNSAFGSNALAANTTGHSNTAIGLLSLANNTIGYNNTGVGMYALTPSGSTVTTGSNNTGVGKYALSTNTTGSNNTAIGYQADVATNNLSNTTVIGSGAIVSASNTIQLGNTSVTNVNTSGTITSGAVTYPKIHGTANQILTTTGSGTLTWTTPTSISIGAIGTATTNGATITSGVLSLAPADGTNGGIVTTSAQTFAGAKTFTTAPVLVGTNITGTAANLSIGGTATTATNISGGSPGSIPYQTGSGTTSLLAAGSSGQVLTLSGTTPTWANPSSGGGAYEILTISSTSAIPSTSSIRNQNLLVVSTNTNSIITLPPANTVAAGVCITVIADANNYYVNMLNSSNGNTISNNNPGFFMGWISNNSVNRFTNVQLVSDGISNWYCIQLF